MENLKVRCKNCNNEIEGQSGKTVSCGCANICSIANNNKITANDLSQVVMTTGIPNNSTNKVLKTEDLMWQEERRKRNVKRLDFEIR